MSVHFIHSFIHSNHNILVWCFIFTFASILREKRVYYTQSDYGLCDDIIMYYSCSCSYCVYFGPMNYNFFIFFISELIWSIWSPYTNGMIIMILCWMSSSYMLFFYWTYTLNISERKRNEEMRGLYPLNLLRNEWERHSFQYVQSQLFFPFCKTKH